MAWTPRDVKDQIVEYPNRFKIDGVSHTVEPDFGTVTESGTDINRAHLQPIETQFVLIDGDIASIYARIKVFKKTTYQLFMTGQLYSGIC